MARETKVGMLLGLGFIVCFAIILENRGRNEQTGPLPPHEILAQAPTEDRSLSGTVAEQRARDYGRPLARRSATSSAELAAGRRHEEGPADPPSTQQRPADTGARGRNAGWRSPADAPAPTAGQRGAPGRFSQRRVLPNVTEDEPAYAATPQVDERPAERGSPIPADGPEPSAANLAATPLAEQPTREPASPPVRYRIKQGDTLSRIATEHYGTGSRRVIDAIYQANRSVLSSPDQLPLDREIVLPRMEGVVAPAGTPEQPAEHPPEKEYKYYQIEKGDRYATIARKLLGSDARWKEIAELNRDIFPDPAKIRYGVRIRLPADARLRNGGDGA